MDGSEALRAARGKLREGCEHIRFGLLGAVRADRADGDLVVVRHHRVDVPHPLQRTCSLNEGDGQLALELPAFFVC